MIGIASKASGTQKIRNSFWKPMANWNKLKFGTTETACWETRDHMRKTDHRIRDSVWIICLKDNHFTSNGLKFDLDYDWLKFIILFSQTDFNSLKIAQKSVAKRSTEILWMDIFNSHTSIVFCERKLILIGGSARKIWVNWTIRIWISFWPQCLGEMSSNRTIITAMTLKSTLLSFWERNHGQKILSRGSTFCWAVPSRGGHMLKSKTRSIKLLAKIGQFLCVPSRMETLFR